MVYDGAGLGRNSQQLSRMIANIDMDDKEDVTVTLYEFVTFMMGPKQKTALSLLKRNQAKFRVEQHKLLLKNPKLRLAYVERHITVCARALIHCVCIE